MKEGTIQIIEDIPNYKQGNCDGCPPPLYNPDVTNPTFPVNEIIDITNYAEATVLNGVLEEDDENTIAADLAAQVQDGEQKRRGRKPNQP